MIQFRHYVRQKGMSPYYGATIDFYRPNFKRKFKGSVKTIDLHWGKHLFVMFWGGNSGSN